MILNCRGVGMNLKTIFGLLIVFSTLVSGLETPVAYYDSLSVLGSEIISSETKEPVQLRGVSLGSANKSNRGSEFYNAKAISSLVDVWNAEVIKAPLDFTSVDDFETDSAYYRTLYETVIQSCIAKGVYVVITWRSSSLNLSANEQVIALSFFSNLAKKFGTEPNVIFEVFENPASYPWLEIKSAQMNIISEIRKYSNNLIIVGTPTFSQDVELVLESPISVPNLVYSFQFNAGTEIPSDLSSNLKTFESKIDAVLEAGYPVFISYFTTVHSDGGAGSHYATHDSSSTKEWLSFLDTKGLSYIAASVSDEYLGSSFFGIASTPAFDQTVKANWKDSSLMTPSGQFIYGEWVHYALSAPWNIESSSSETPMSSSIESPSSSSEIPLSSSTEQVSSSSSALLVSVIDDFTDGNSRANNKEYWYVFTDKNDNGESTVGNTPSGTSYVVVYDDGVDNKAASIQDFSLVQGENENDPYVALGLNTTSNGSSYYLESCTEGFSYRYKGVAHRFRVNISTVTDHNNHYKVMPAKSVWTKVVVLPTELEQDTWGEEVDFDPAFIESFIWEVKKAPTSGDLWIDDFICLGADLGFLSSSSSVVKTSSSNASSSSQASSSSSVENSSSSVVPSSSSSVVSSSSTVLISLIDDFTDGNSRANNKEYWYIFTDVKDKGKSTVSNTLSGSSYEIVIDDGSGNNAASIQDFTLDQGLNKNDPYVALGLNTAGNGSSYLLKNCKDGFSYRYKGVPHRFRANLSTVMDYNYHFKTIPAATSWTKVVVLPSELKQESWGEKVTFNSAYIEAFVWEVKKTPTSGTLWIDDFYCLGTDLGLQPSSSSVSSSSSGTVSISKSNSIVKWIFIENGRTLSLNLEEKTMASLDVFDIQGNAVMKSKRLTSDNNLISLEALSSGRYIARIRIRNKQMMIPLRIP